MTVLDPAAATIDTAWWQPGEACVVHVPSGRRGSHGDLVGEVAEMMGRPLDPHQQVAVDAINSYGRGGRWLAMECVVIGPRQTTGKTSAIVLPSVLANLLTRREPDRTVWTAHRLKTSLDTFRDLKHIIESQAEFSRRVARVSDKDGEEGIWFTNGSWLEFAARSDGAGRGLAAEEFVGDEALYLSATMLGDLLPITASKANPRVLYASSAPKAGSGPLHALMKRGRAGDPTVIYVEYRSPGRLKDAECAIPRCRHEAGTPGCVLDDERLLKFGNPGLTSGRIRIEVLDNLRTALPPEEYAREMHGWEEPPDDGATRITVADWAARVDPDSGVAPGVAPVFALDVSPDRRSAAIAVAGPRADGGRHVGLVAHDRGDRWAIDRLVELAAHQPRAIVLDGASPAAAFLPDLKEAGLEVRSKTVPWGVLVVTGPGEMGQACGGLQSAVLQAPAPAPAGDSDGDGDDDVPVAGLWHRGDPIVSRALADAASRDLGDGAWAWARRRSEGDITPLVAVTLAAWGDSTCPAGLDELVY